MLFHDSPEPVSGRSDSHSSRHRFREAVFVLLFRRLLPEAKALSAVVLYRFDTMLLPCAIGAFFVLGEKISSFRRKKATTDGYDS